MSLIEHLTNPAAIEYGYWSIVAVLVLINLIAIVLYVFMLPGNWLMTIAVILYVCFSRYERGPGWIMVGVTVSLAVLGEILETVLGSAKAARRGASRRAMVFSLVLSIVGSIAGTFVIPIPLIGSAMGAVLGAAVGAFAGAWLGEASLGTDREQRIAIGTAALTGRMIGMGAKLIVGAVIFVVQLVSFWF